MHNYWKKSPFLFIFRNNEMKLILFGDIKLFNLYICKMLELSRPYSGNVLSYIIFFPLIASPSFLHLYVHMLFEISILKTRIIWLLTHYDDQINK